MRRLAVDLRILAFARTGFFRYAQGCLQSLAEASPGFEVVLLRSPGQDLGEVNLGGWREVETAAEVFAEGEAEMLRDTLRAREIDAVHFPSSLFPGRVAPRVMLTLHDLTVLEHPETIEARYRSAYRGAIEGAAAADVLLVDSRSVAAALRARNPDVDPVVLHPLTPFEGHGTARVVASGPSGEGRLVLAVGALEPRKRPRRLLSAWQVARERLGSPLRLVIVASHGWLEAEFRDALRRSPWRREVEILRDVDDAGLVGLLESCTVFLSVSRYEGFGLPVLEAAHAGACVLSTPVPSLLEAGVRRDAMIPAGAPGAEIGVRLAELLGDPERRREHTTAMRSTLDAYYRGQAPDRLVHACSDLMLSVSDPGGGS